MSKPEEFLFPDTNAFIHWPTFDDVDWTSLVGGAPVVLVLTRTVIAELDRHKNENENKSKRLRERAATTVAKIEALAESGASVRKGVRIEALSAYARKGNAPVDLDLDRPDDCHIASALEFAGARSVAVQIVTGDTGMRLTARAQAGDRAAAREASGSRAR